MSGSPTSPPLGIELTRTAREVGRAFEQALEDAGGSRPLWLILITLKQHPQANQRQIATQIGIEGATVTHHLNGMEADGLLTRRRDPANRRVHVVELTPAGEEMFHRLRRVVAVFDRQLRGSLDDAQVAVLRQILATLRQNVAQPLPAPSSLDAPAICSPPVACAEGGSHG
ncbi:MAG: MarR family winged helix-turn-helix transcriptional regulator [Chloroflexota bacterium]|nr:MarR family winged helix-turn-helix transcriptional regulator [Chloroflexota bacterium]